MPERIAITGAGPASSPRMTRCPSSGMRSVAMASAGWPWKPTNANAGFTIARGIPPRQDLKPGESAVAPPPRYVEAPADLPLFALEARAFAAACLGEADSFMPEEQTLANVATMAQVTGA